MKLFSTIVIFDVCVVAESEEAARTALLAMIRDADDPQAPNELNAREITQEREIRHALRETKPIVGADISDQDFALVKGKTNVEMFTKLYTKKK